jgi:hypothetical protein
VIYPERDVRLSLAGRSVELREADDETAEANLVGLLNEIGGYLQEGVPEDIRDERSAKEVLSSVISWASIISYTVANVYAPMTPFPQRVAGWAPHVSKALLDLVALLRKHLEVAVHYLRSQNVPVSFSIGLSFPWAGVQVSLNFG